MRIVVLVGTRPEAIKLAPLCIELLGRPKVDLMVVASGQHDELATSVLDEFDIPYQRLPLPVDFPSRSIAVKAAMISSALSDFLAEYSFDWLVVHGDTTTTAMSAYVAFLHGVPVAHVEAGLRSGDLRQPFPEEANRRIVAVLAEQHFAPTELAGSHLIAEGILKDKIHVVGNTIVDALQLISSRRPKKVKLPEGEFALVTSHRRENWDKLHHLSEAVKILARSHPATSFVLPLHPNPRIRKALSGLHELPNVKLVEPMKYGDFVSHLAQARLVITDSGGIQEEAATLGTPCLIARDSTERPEALAPGSIELCPMDSPSFPEMASSLLTFSSENCRNNPFGDGKAAVRIADILEATSK